MPRPKKGELPPGYHAAVAVLNGECETAAEAAAQYQLHHDTVYIWLRKLKEDQGLVQFEPTGLQAAKAFLAGQYETVNEAAAAFGCETTKGVHKWLRQMGKGQQKERRTFPWKEIEAQLGKVPDIVISKQFGIDRGLLSRRRKRLGIPLVPAKSRRPRKTAKPALDIGALKSALIAAPKDPVLVKAAREAASLNQREAAELVGAITGRGWLRYETGERQIGDDRWTLFLLLTNQHPKFQVLDR